MDQRLWNEDEANWWENKEIVKHRQKSIETKKVNESKKQLGAFIEKKIKTTMIGSLDDFEKAFGYLWGHGKRSDELSETEIGFRALWMQARTAILDRGNAQISHVWNDLNHYTVKYNGRTINVTFKKNQD